MLRPPVPSSSNFDVPHAPKNVITRNLSIPLAKVPPTTDPATNRMPGVGCTCKNTWNNKNTLSISECHFNHSWLTLPWLGSLWLQSTHWTRCTWLHTRGVQIPLSHTVVHQVGQDMCRQIQVSLCKMLPKPFSLHGSCVVKDSPCRGLPKTLVPWGPGPFSRHPKPFFKAGSFKGDPEKHCRAEMAQFRGFLKMFNDI